MNINPVKTSRVNGLVTSGTPTVVLAKPGTLITAILSVKATARFIKFYDTDQTPTIADTPVFIIYMPAAGVPPVLWFGEQGFPFRKGIAFRMATNGIDNDATYTSFAADDSCITCVYQEGNP